MNTDTIGINVHDRGQLVLETIFGGQDEGKIDESFCIVENKKNNTGKLYLPLHVSLKELNNTDLGFKIQAEVREEKVVLHF